MLTKEQIQRFFSYKCSPEEADAVAGFFERHPEELDKYLSDAEWEHFRFENGLEAQKASSILKEIKRKTVAPKSEKIYYLRYLTGAAAALIVGFFILQKLLPPKEAKQDVISKYESKLITNNGDKALTITLQDSSVIRLAPGSTIGYTEPFQDSVRHIELKGEAYFEVTRNPQMPFTVSSYPLHTTVLGTTFSIRGFEDEKQIKIFLFKGLITVGNADSLHPVVKSPLYMSVGDMLVYDKATMSVHLSPAKKPVNTKKDTQKILDEHNTLQGNNWYMFNNQPLSGVFDQLSLLYGQKIYYVEEDIKGLSFIGKIDKTDTLETVLNLLGKLNKLTVTRVSNGYLIKKN
ncbi:MAG: FecR family protein [Chitinophagaceae bacterium]|nr:FecR family protein [Chitinophagaceae bacterium]MCW5928459.1 FecR family protein [Chitinophagaceae bacterium]